jgi:hypothetical protein
MPSHTANHWVQAIETIGGSLSCVVCLYVARQVHKQRSRNVTNSMLVHLFLVDAALTFFYAIGRGGMENKGFCQFQGLMIQWLSVATFLWMMLMIYIMYQWIVRKKHPKRMEKTINRSKFAMMFVSFVLSIILLATGAFGDSYLWCWITLDHVAARIICFEIILFFSWIASAFALYEINRSLKVRIDQKGSVSARIGQLLNSNLSVQKKLTAYVSVYIFVWFFTILDRSVEYSMGHTIYSTAILQAIFLPLQGFLNVVVYMDWLHLQRSSSGGGIPFLGGKKLHEMELREIMVEPTEKNMSTKTVVKSFVPKRISVFTTTFNMGEAPLQSLYADVKDWIVEGHDVYAIGLQECIDLTGIRDLILSHLGGPSKYAMYTTSIGSGNTSLGYHGFIALTVYVKVSDLTAGYIHATKAASETMATGADLIVTTAQNKGAVGVSLQIHDTNIGFVTCHLPSDSKGKSKLTKRNASAHAILKEVTLAPEDLGFDLHIQHDHVMVFGDLNYRMDTSGSGSGVNSLTGVAVACTIEKHVLGDDSLWLMRKYNLLRHPSDPLYPTIEDVKLLHEAKLQSRGAWSSLLRADELRSIMDDGDAFYGFLEPMPCFPPSYTRRKGIEADCGDYSEFRSILKGYSNTGEVENMLEAELQKKEQTNGAAIIKSVGRRLKQTVTKDEIAFIPDDLSHGARSEKPSSSVELQSAANMTMEVGTVEGEADDFADDEEREDATRISGSEKNQKRRKAVLGKQPTKLDQKSVVDPSKLRPPSYTDRILVHSLPDRKDRVTVQSYDFCDTLRVSDHRAVSMTLLLDVNGAVKFNNSEQQVHSDVSMIEPKFELYELKITNMTVQLSNWEYSKGDDGEEDDDRDSLASDLESVRSMSDAKTLPDGHDMNPMHSMDSDNGGVQLRNFSEDVDKTDSQSKNNSVSSRPPAPKKQSSIWRRLSSNSSASPTGGRASRKKSLISSILTGNADSEHVDELYEMYGKPRTKEQDEEDEIIKEMGSESLSWHSNNEGAWRKKVENEQKRLRNENSEKLSISLKVKKLKKKAPLKNIDLITVVFPLPVKDPLLAHRRVYDYSTAFDDEPIKRKDMTDLEKNK